MITLERACNDNSIGELIKAKRLEKGLTLRELGDMVGTSGGAISRWESGKRIPTVDIFDAIMEALGSDVLVVKR